MKNKVQYLSKKYKNILIFICVIALQLIVAAFYMNSKQFMYIDEYYSYEGAHNALLYRFGEDGFRLSTDDEEYYKWHTKEYFLSHFEVRGDESILQHSPAELKSILKTKNVYYILLNIAESFQSNPAFTKWTGFVLNCIIFVFHQIVFYLVGREIFQDKRKAMFPMILFGFSAGGISLVTFIRVYLLKSLLCLLIVYFHMKLLTWQNIWGIILAYGVTGIAVLLIWGFQPYIVLYAASAVFVFMIVCLVNKKYKLLLRYVAAGCMGALAVVLFMPQIMSRLLSYAASDVGVSAINSFLRRPIIEYGAYFKYYFWKALSHSADGVYNIAAILIILAVLWWVQKQKGKVQWKKFEYFNQKAYFIVSTSLCYFITGCGIFDAEAYRYMSCIYAGLCVGMAILVEWILDSCQVRAYAAVLCAVVLSGLFVGYIKGYVDDMNWETSYMRDELARDPTASNLFILYDKEEDGIPKQYYRNGFLMNDGTKYYMLKPEDIESTDYSFLADTGGTGVFCWFPIYYWVWTDDWTSHEMEQILVHTDYKNYEKVFSTIYFNVYYIY